MLWVGFVVLSKEEERWRGSGLRKIHEREREREREGEGEKIWVRGKYLK